VSVSIKDFQPINTWKPEEGGEQVHLRHELRARFIIDETTGRKYFNEYKGDIRFECFPGLCPFAAQMVKGNGFITPLLNDPRFQPLAHFE
jgi:hypothetical protein